MVVGKFWLESNLATYAGVGFMILASFWNARGIKHPGGEQASPSENWPLVVERLTQRE